MTISTKVEIDVFTSLGKQHIFSVDYGVLEYRKNPDTIALVLTNEDTQVIARIFSTILSDPLKKCAITLKHILRDSCDEYRLKDCKVVDNEIVTSEPVSISHKET